MLCPSGTLGMMGRDRALEAWNNSKAVSRALIVFIAISTFSKALPAAARSAIVGLGCVANAMCRTSDKHAWMIRYHNDGDE
jgi:hypothetical protein